MEAERFSSSRDLLNYVEKVMHRRVGPDELTWTPRDINTVYIGISKAHGNYVSCGIVHSSAVSLIRELKAEHRRKKKELRRACLMAFLQGFNSVMMKLAPWAIIATALALIAKEVLV
jgi:hypothetical protein